MAMPLVAIVGRPNVGKSTLFNRLLGGRKAIVVDTPGATRDRNYGEATWRGRAFTVVDTGGFEPLVTEGIAVDVREQASLAVEEADLTLLLLDGQGGLTPDDIELVELMRRWDQPLLIAVNKIDDQRHEERLYEFYALGIEPLYPISAEHGRAQHLAFRRKRQLSLFLSTLKQRHIQPQFQLAQMPADRRMTDIEPTCRRADATGVINGCEGPKCVQR